MGLLTGPSHRNGPLGGVGHCCPTTNLTRRLWTDFRRQPPWEAAAKNCAARAALRLRGLPLTNGTRRVDPWTVGRAMRPPNQPHGTVLI
jgi:hypothetical protein